MRTLKNELKFVKWYYSRYYNWSKKIVYEVEGFGNLAKQFISELLHTDLIWLMTVHTIKRGERLFHKYIYYLRLYKLSKKKLVKCCSWKSHGVDKGGNYQNILNGFRAYRVYRFKVVFVRCQCDVLLYQLSKNRGQESHFSHAPESISKAVVVSAGSAMRPQRQEPEWLVWPESISLEHHQAVYTALAGALFIRQNGPIPASLIYGHTGRRFYCWYSIVVTCY